jgi:hypothetical protein
MPDSLKTSQRLTSFISGNLFAAGKQNNSLNISFRNLLESIPDNWLERKGYFS